MHRLFSKHRAALVWLVLWGAVFLVACSLADEPVPAGPVEVGPLPGQESKLAPSSLPDLADGAGTFAARCAACHGPGGKGDGPQSGVITQQGGHVPDFTDPAFARSSSPLAWFTTITNGNIAKLMPPWEQTLTDQQCWNVTYYLTTLSASGGDLAAGKTGYEANCGSCHGPDGSQNGLTDPKKMAALSAQEIYSNYIAAGTDGVHNFADQLDDPSRWAVAAYVRSFSHGAVPAPITPTIAPTLAATAEPTEVTPTVIGSVSGKVTNGTQGAAIPAGLKVEVKGVAVDMHGMVTEFVTQETTVAADGAYRFDDLPFDQAQSGYIVSVKHAELTYQNFQAVDPAAPAMDLPVVIYEATHDVSVVRLDAVHYYFRQQQDALLAIQVMVFSNTGDRAYIAAEPLPGGQQAGVAFSLPPDAASLSFDTGALGGRFVQTGALVYDTQPLLPGQGSDTVSASYVLPYTGGRDISFPVQYPTLIVNVLASPDVQVTGGGLVKGVDREFQEQMLSTYSTQNLAVGQSLDFNVGQGLQTLDILRIVLSVMLVLLVISAGVYWWMRSGAIQTAPAVFGDDAARALLRQIAELDEAFEVGKVNRLDYEARRADLKAQVAEHME